MRYISVSHIKENMELSSPVYGSNFGVLISVGTKLSDHHVKRIKEMGYAGIYVSDDISAGIEIKDIIPTAVRLQTLKSTKEIIQRAETGGFKKNSIKVSKANQEKIVMPIISALISNPHRIVDLIDLKPFEDYTYYHSANVVILSLLIGVELGLSGNQLYELGLSALLHDVGNAFIPKTILNKPGKLSTEEFDTIKSHPQLGFDFLREHFELSIEACMGALHHHENYDGSGYPNKLKKDKISIYGRIISLTTVYDALTSRRPFRGSLFPPAAMRFIDMNTGVMFDPQIVKAFKDATSLYPAGVCVELDSKLRCIVVQNYTGDSARPLLKILDSNSKTPTYINLHENEAFRNTKISQIIEYL